MTIKAVVLGIGILLLAGVGLVLAFAVIDRTSRLTGAPLPGAGRTAEATISGVPFVLELADIPPLRARGLSGRRVIPPTGGMLFLFPAAGRYTFWMKGMLVPIDIIWVSGGTIVGIVHDARPPEFGEPDLAIARYTAPEPVDRVIELAAGRARELGLEPGHEVRILLP